MSTAAMLGAGSLWVFSQMRPEQWNLLLNFAGIILGGGALGVVLSHFRGMRGLNNADVADIRKHYADELQKMRDRDDERDEALRQLEKHWREMFHKSDERHEECVREREALRDQLREFKSEIAGLKDQIRAQAADRVLLLEERCVSPSADVAGSARRVKDIIEDKKK